MNYHNASVLVSVLLTISVSIVACSAADDDAQKIPKVTRAELSSSQTSRLLVDAERFAKVIARGTDGDLAPIVASMYEQGLSDPYVRSLIFGPSEYRDKKGFREILRGMSEIKAVAGSAFKIDGKNAKLRARAYFFDPARTTSEGVLKDKKCRDLRVSYVSQIFEWDGNSWRPCCLLFESETDGPC